LYQRVDRYSLCPKGQRGQDGGGPVIPARFVVIHLDLSGQRKGLGGIVRVGVTSCTSAQFVVVTILRLKPRRVMSYGGLLLRRKLSGSFCS